MQPVLIENPILNSPFEEPKRHFLFDAHNRITGEVSEGRRPSSHWVPVPTPRRQADPTLFEDMAASERKTESFLVNRLRAVVRQWRADGYPAVTETTLGLLKHWQAKDRGRRLFFCQVEAL